MGMQSRPVPAGLFSLALALLVVAGADLVRASRSAGPAPRPPAPGDLEDGIRLFEEEVAPLLARACLDCHDPGSKKGGVDLTTLESTLAGGLDGPVLEPGNPDESALWLAVEDDSMPWGRDPLSDGEKASLRRWIELGAPWSIDRLESPAASRPKAPAELRVRRLTVPEYVETVRSAVGVDVEQEAARLLPRDQRADGFSNTAYNQTVDLGHVEALALLAELIVDRLDVEAFASRFSPPGDRDEAALRRRIERMGLRLLRGPLDDREVESFLSVARSVLEEGGDFEEATSYVVEAMLQAPRFVYRVEAQRGDGSTRPVGDFELASRLSYLLWGGPPDEELLRAAGAGELSDRVRVAAQVQRMLRDPRAVDRGERFIEEWLFLDQLGSLGPDAGRFPNWSEDLAADMRAETLAFFREVAWERNRPLWDLLDAQVTFATPRLAAHYGLDPTAGADRDDYPPEGPPSRVADGLLARYLFDEGEGAAVRDRSGSAEPIDLTIADPSAVEWSDEGLRVRGRTLIVSGRSPPRLTDAIKESRAMTIEAWITPADLEQDGPARIVTLSSDVSSRNFTVGQDGDKADVRLRTSKTDPNGSPSLSGPAGSLAVRPTAIVYTYDSGRARLFIDGRPVADREVDGDLSAWQDGLRFALANEVSGERPWRGTLHRVSIYSRAFDAEEIRSWAGGDPSDRASWDRPARIDLASVPARGGLLTQGSTLVVGGDEASMVARGLFVLHDLLDSTVGAPPPCVDTTPKPSEPGRSQRAIATERVENPSCGGCHAKFEPLAFGLERFDGIGGYREVDEFGNALRDDGEIRFPGDDRAIPYASSAELMGLLAGSDRVRETITRRLVQFAIGRPLVEADDPVVARIHAGAVDGGGTYASLMAAIALSDLILTTRTEPDPEAPEGR